MALIIYSGGLDSTVLLYKLASEGKADGALWVNYGQKHKKEYDCAKYNCDKLNIKLDVADLSSLKEIFGNSSLTDDKVEVPDGNYKDDNMKSTVVPNRNMIMLSIAAARAIALGTDSVAYAAHCGDHTIYPDCRKEFADALDSVLNLCHYTPIHLYRPFVNIDKTQIVKIGKELGVDFNKTWSCYKGGDIHCGTCGTCTERIEAFKLAGIDDTTLYKSKENF